MDIEGAGHEVCIGPTTHFHEMILLYGCVAIFYEYILYTLLLMIMWLYNAHLEIFMWSYHTLSWNDTFIHTTESWHFHLHMYVCASIFAYKCLNIYIYKYICTYVYIHVHIHIVLLYGCVAIFYEYILYTLLLMIMWLYNAHLEIFMRLYDALLESIVWLCVQNMCIA